MEGWAPSLQPIVAVPARNEQQRLPLLLEALARQTWQTKTQKRLRVIVVANNCVDGTGRVALDTARTLPSLTLELIEIEFPPACAHVGSARRLAMEEAVAKVAPSGCGVVLTTDADAVPEAEWVEANLRAIASGADLVGGLLYGNRAEEARFGPGFAARAATVAAYAANCDRLASLIDPSVHDPWPRHRDHTGGSLAITAGTYKTVGGLPPLASREDLALVSLVRAAGGRLVHPLDVRVEVSARLVGRAPGGMADCLKEWLRAEAEGFPILVEDPHSVRARLTRRKTIRDIGEGRPETRHRELMRLGVKLDGLTEEEVERLSTPALVERFAPEEPDSLADTDAGRAIVTIEAMIADLENPIRGLCPVGSGAAAYEIVQ